MKGYLGDGAYAEVVDGRLELTAENGIQATDRVVLEPEVWTALLYFLEQARDAGEWGRSQIGT